MPDQNSNCLLPRTPIEQKQTAFPLPKEFFSACSSPSPPLLLRIPGVGSREIRRRQGSPAARRWGCLRQAASRGATDESGLRSWFPLTCSQGKRLRRSPPGLRFGPLTVRGPHCSAAGRCPLSPEACLSSASSRCIFFFKWTTMSASTAAIPAVNTNGSHALSLDSHSSQHVRRRTVVVAKKKVTPELLAEGGVNGISEDKNSSKDFVHTIRGESVLDKSKHPSEARKDVASATIAERRKKGATKQEKSKWITALSVLVKLCLLIAAITWMGQLFFRWQNGELSFTALDMDSRLSSVEGFKKTTKMLQVQLDILDKKLGNEIDKTKRDITKQLEENGNKLETKMNILEGKTEELDKSLDELRDMGFVSKKEFEEILGHLKKKKGLDGNNDDISLDDIRLYAKEIVELEIARHAADGLGMVDYALGSGGGKVTSHSEHFKGGKTYFSGRSGVQPMAQKMLEPSFGQPGECFALQGSSGFVNIKLRTEIIPEAITLEHVDKSVAYDRSSAPKDFKVQGWYEGSQDDLDKDLNTVTTLGEFSYDLEKSNAQTFQLERTADTDSRVINMVRFDFSSNHGNSEHTCIYRFRVHGIEPASTKAH